MHCQGAGRGHCSGTWVFGLPAGGLLPSTPLVARSWGAACNAPDFDLDLDGAFRDIKDLIRRGLTVGEKKGGRVYRVLETAAPSAVPEDLEPLLAPLRANGFIKNADVRDRLGIIRRQALVLLTEWTEGKRLVRHGERKARQYLPGPHLQL